MWLGKVGLVKFIELQTTPVKEEDGSDASDAPAGGGGDGDNMYKGGGGGGEKAKVKMEKVGAKITVPASMSKQAFVQRAGILYDSMSGGGQHSREWEFVVKTTDKGERKAVTAAWATADISDCEQELDY